MAETHITEAHGNV